ncbi:MAG TPA: ABC transporter ATP-binding protein, partial [Ktedonobacteraceae bacterium]|nr:ABC transporter ATP-binding protein [Ktedonobacteraceae bacterium]
MPTKSRERPKIGESTRRRLHSAGQVGIAMRQMSTLAWRAQPLCFVGVVALQLLQGLLPLATAWLAKLLFDLLAQSLGGHPSSVLIPQMFFLLALQALVILLGLLLNPVTRYFTAELTRRLTLNMKSTIYRKLNSLSGLAYFEDPTFHDIIQTASMNAQFGPMQALTIFTTIVQGIMTLLSFLGVLLALSPWLTCMIAIAIIPQCSIELKLSKQRFDVILMNSPRERRASYYGQVLSMVQFAKEMRLFNLGEYFLRKFVSTTEEIYQTQRDQQRRELRWQLVLAVGAAAISTTAFVVVLLQAFSGQLSLGNVALYISAVGSVQAALTGLVLALSQANDSVLFFRQYTDLLNLAQPPGQSTAPRQVPPLTDGITLCDVSFRYSEQHPWTLRHVNLFLPAHRCLALVGLNGAGKTTLVKLLTRLYDPTEGQILWDGIDLREFDPQEMRRHMGANFQDFSRYDLSVQENIGLGDVEQVENVSLIQKAAIKAGIHERIEAFPQGYQSILSRWLAPKNEGVDLSGGEWQKLALARVFLRDSEVLILDEPTAALDAEA